MNTPMPEHPAKPLSQVLCFWHAVVALGGLPLLFLLSAGSDSASLGKSLGVLWAFAWMAWPLWWPICLIAGRRQIKATLKALLVPSAMWAVPAAFLVWILFHLPIM